MVNRSWSRAAVHDIAFAACYCEELGSWRFETDLSTRKNKTGVLSLEDFKEKDVHVYFGFLSTRFKDSSDSEYLGLIRMMA